MIDRRRLLATGLAAPILVRAVPATASVGTPKPSPWGYMLGADVTWLGEDEAVGATYFVDGQRQDLFQILKQAGFNWIKLRTFVDPARGYSISDPVAAWGGIVQTARLGRRVKDAGLKLAISLHYADGWADPQKQPKPAAWQDLQGAALERAVHDYTRSVLEHLHRSAAAPDLAIIGNETTFGFLWPDGRIPLRIPTGNPVTDASHALVPDAGGYDGFAALVRAGIAGARSVDPDLKIQLHNHLGRRWVIVEDYMDNLLARGVEFDALGLSCYQQVAEGDWENTFRNFSLQYPDHGFLVAEYSSRKRYLNDLVRQTGGWGSFIWEPTRHQEAIFDKDGRPAGEGPRPNLLSQGLNAAEAPGGQAAIAAPEPADETLGKGGRYDANGFLAEYRQMARDYGLM